MGLNLLCALTGHKWTPAEASTETDLRMVCRRCGRTRRGVYRREEHPADTDKPGSKYPTF
jgi:prophage protein DUF1660